MNTYKAILDTRRPNGVIANITQFDNATLELQIVTNGEIGDAWDQPQFELVAMKRDQQAVRESNQDAFTIVDCSEHRVTLELKEQFLTCRGSVKMQLIVKDGDRLSTSVFYVMIGESLDHGIVESHRDVAVLDELEQYVKTGYDSLAHQEQRMKDVEKATHELNELMIGNEAGRQEAESKRQALFEGNEGQRQNTFNQQLTSQRREFDDSQADREGAFNDLKQNMSSEFNTAQNEREREFDTMMSSNQAQFDSAERSRANTFNNRQIENERVFTANENARQSLFNTNEAGRKTNETDRVANENTRKNNETGRVAAESKRQQKMSEFEAKATQLSDELDAQVARVDAFVSANEEKLLGDRDKVDYMGNTHESVKAASDANVDWLLGEVNTAHYEGQHITATETIEGRAKSAILKGNTLVNLATPIKYKPIMYHGYCLVFNGSMLKSGEYTLKSSVDFSQYVINLMSTQKDRPSQYRRITIRKNGVFTIDDTFFVANTLKTEDFFICLRPIDDSEAGSVTTNEIENCEVILLEGDYTNVDIPYFEGMQSVKMPVLTTTGKNLLNLSSLSNSCSIRDGGYYIDVTLIKGGSNYNLFSGTFGLNTVQKDISNFIKLKPNTTYTLSRAGESSATVSGSVFDLDGNRIVGTSALTSNASSRTFTTTENAIYFAPILSSAYSNETTTIIGLQLEEGSTRTTYEPFKSNILTVNEDVELRGISEVKDELDLLTGEMTVRIGEVVYDGSDDENWDVAYINVDGLIGIATNIPNDMKYLGANRIDGFINDRLKQAVSENMSIYSGYGGWRMFAIYMDSSTFDSAQKIKQWLSQNPITVQYTLNTESVKTVDLSDNAVYSYDEVTHYDCSSEAGSLIPTLSVDVPTNLPSLVSRQRATIETLERENRELKAGQSDLEAGHERQEEEIISTQDAVNFLLFDVLDMVPYELGQKEYDRMAVYIANQIIRGKVTYQLAVSKYPQFLTDIDEILVNEGRGDLIVKID